MTSLAKKNQLVAVLLTGIVLFHFFNNFFWLERDTVLTGHGSNWQLIEAVKFQIEFKKILHADATPWVKTGQALHLFSNWKSVNWPPLVYFLSAVINPRTFYLFRVRMYLNFIFFIALILSAYFLGKKCFDRTTGLIASFLVSFYPAVYIFSRQFGLNFPLLCLTSVCLCLLAYSEAFSKRGYSLAFGLCLGLATLVKLQVMFFILVPWLYEIFGVFRKNRKLYACFNLLLSLAITAFFFSLFWGNRLDTMFSSFNAHAFSLYPFHKGELPLRNLAMMPPVLSLQSVFFYLTHLPSLTSPFLFLLFLVALGTFFIQGHKWRLLFSLNVVASYFILSALSMKFVKYGLPMLISMAVISAGFLSSLRSKYVRAFLLGIVVLYGVGLCLVRSWTLYNDCPVPLRFFYQPIATGIPSPPKLDEQQILAPKSYDYIAELKKSGLIASIEQGMKEGKTQLLEFDGVAVENTIVWLYLYFQEAISEHKIDIQNTRGREFGDADYIALRDSELPEKKGLLERYRVLSQVGKTVFLIKI